MTFPFADIKDGETVYLAIHAKYADRVDAILAALPVALVHLQEYRVMLIVFSDRLERFALFDEATKFEIAKRNWHDGGLLDPVIGVFLADHACFPRNRQPSVFIFSDGDIACNWNPGILSQLLNAVWLHEASQEPMLTPFGERQTIVLQAAGVP